jgi:hypothetical protein
VRLVLLLALKGSHPQKDSPPPETHLSRCETPRQSNSLESSAKPEADPGPQAIGTKSSLSSGVPGTMWEFQSYVLRSGKRRQWEHVLLKGSSFFCCSPSDHTTLNVGKIFESIARIGCPTETRLFRVRVDPVPSPTRRIWLGYLRRGGLLGAEGGCQLLSATPFARSSKPSAVR